MALIIINVSERYGIKYGSGLQKYEVRINNKVMAEFDHRFEDGLGGCLAAALIAVSRKEADPR